MYANDQSKFEPPRLSLTSRGFPSRIVCLTEEPTEVLYAIGESQRIVGSARLDRILALEPDLAIGFSDIQADIAQALIKAGVEVWIANHRSVDGILAYVQRLSALVGAAAKGEAYAAELAAGLDGVRRAAAALPQRPKVYFEEWDDPPISCIRWVSELITIAGGDDIFPERAQSALARGRILDDPAEVIRRAPDIVIGSWCGKKFRAEQVAARPGWASIPAVRAGELHEVKSPLILQPGPAALTDGLAALHRIIAKWSHAHTRRA
jgi:iron complex transport system substrate-binding protein